MPKDFELSGPAFVGLFVRDVVASTAFYEKTLGFRRDPEGFRIPGGAGVTFLSYPILFAISPAPPGVDLSSLPRPILVPALWFKTANSQVVHDALVKAGVTILRPLKTARFGRQFTFVAPDGYAITIYDRDAPPDGWENSD
jgi:catechol 2,3-dioxygenase-like lactoylglutathione lyase family enzyme